MQLSYSQATEGSDWRRRIKNYPSHLRCTQGSVLGPLLFLIYIDDVARVSLSEGSTLVLCADDVLLYRKIDSTEDFFALQRDINGINNWTKENHITFNVAKCKYAYFP